MIENKKKITAVIVFSDGENWASNVTLLFLRDTISHGGSMNI